MCARPPCHLLLLLLLYGAVLSCAPCRRRDVQQAQPHCASSSVRVAMMLDKPRLQCPRPLCAARGRDVCYASALHCRRAAPSRPAPRARHTDSPKSSGARPVNRFSTMSRDASILHNFQATARETLTTAMPRFAALAQSLMARPAHNQAAARERQRLGTEVVRLAAKLDDKLLNSQPGEADMHRGYQLAVRVQEEERWEPVSQLFLRLVREYEGGMATERAVRLATARVAQFVLQGKVMYSTGCLKMPSRQPSAAATLDCSSPPAALPAEASVPASDAEGEGRSRRRRRHRRGDSRQGPQGTQAVNSRRHDVRRGRADAAPRGCAGRPTESSGELPAESAIDAAVGDRAVPSAPLPSGTATSVETSSATAADATATGAAAAADPTAAARGLAAPGDVEGSAFAPVATSTEAEPTAASAQAAATAVQVVLESATVASESVAGTSTDSASPPAPEVAPTASSLSPAADVTATVPDAAFSTTSLAAARSATVPAVAVAFGATTAAGAGTAAAASAVSSADSFAASAADMGSGPVAEPQVSARGQSRICLYVTSIAVISRIAIAAFIVGSRCARRGALIFGLLCLP